ETPRSLYAKLERVAVAVLDRSLPRLLAGTATRTPLDLRQGSYFGGRKPEDGRLDWTWTALRNYYLVRGVTHPYPGAFTYLDGRKLFVWWASPVDADHQAPPGTVLSVAPDGCLVAAAQGALLITRCQLEHEDELDASGFCTLHGVHVGTRLANQP
ncbi:MAG TPA: hypothetical protein VN436_04685, partial [Holophaga sp.]|nr:hypothetical protein [Holophaga sp.]